MKSGMIAAEAIFTRLKTAKEEEDHLSGREIVEYETNIMNSWIADELKVTIYNLLHYINYQS
jgi:flavin-dependent dehydrogenase